jgi:hypothetical protein
MVLSQQTECQTPNQRRRAWARPTSGRQRQTTVALRMTKEQGVIQANTRLTMLSRVLEVCARCLCSDRSA